MRFSILASGSKGNCMVIYGEETTLAIDCGGSKKYLMEALNKEELELQDIDALLVTHTHKDHIGRINLFKNHKVYTPETLNLEKEILVAPYVSFTVNEFIITPFPLSHDCEITLGYKIEQGNDSLICVSDTGYVSLTNQKIMKNATYYVFESNHDIEMLMKSSKPHYIKQRIVSDKGHLCNEDSANILRTLVGNKTKLIILSHLSESSNCEKLALDIHQKKINSFFPNIKIKVAKQYEIVKGDCND